MRSHAISNLKNKLVRAVTLGVLFCFSVTVWPAEVFADLLAKFETPRAEASLLGSDTEAVNKPNPGGGLPEIRKVDAVKDRYGLVAILVEESVWKGTDSSAGLSTLFGGNSLAKKVRTYAEDVQKTLPWTKTLILTVGKNESTVGIHRLLEKLYFEGNPKDSEATQLSGVVLIGEVPVSVVNKNDQSYPSLFPYTDFRDPSFLLNESTQDFVPNPESTNPQAEIWHGVITPPLSGEEGMDLLSAYFDKNHAYHQGESSATDFDKKVLEADFITEEDTLNSTSFSAYERWRSIWEETFYTRYTNDLLEKLYTETMASMQAGDGIDNDEDGQIDEEAENSKDDDGDGEVDEDLGDSLYKIDNDEDGETDEDGFEDNNNDKNQLVGTYADASNLFKDKRVDEDPPGDSNGDGCRGVCGEDDNGDSIDHDGDGYPTGWELQNDYDPMDSRRPFKRVSKMVKKMYDVDFTGDEKEDEKAYEYLADKFIDKFNGEGMDGTCYDSSGTAHPEWDDDEDGFCDEDGSTELMSNGCAYNDGDCDGTIDEDPTGKAPESKFDQIPDIRSREWITALTRQYSEIFEQPVGTWNRLIEQTGRYRTRQQDADGNLVNDYDSPVSLIAKKDSLTQRTLGSVNEKLEKLTTTLVDDELQKNIPMVAVMQITGTYKVDDEDDEEDLCDVGQAPDLDKEACLQFVNHSTNRTGVKFENYDGDGDSKKIHIAGKNMWEIDSVSDCTIYAGTDEEGGQIVEFNTLYDRNAIFEDRSDVKDRNNCVADAYPYKEDIPEICTTSTVEEPIKSYAGAKKKSSTGGVDMNFGACYEFKEMTSFKDFYDAHDDFNDWLSRQLRKFRRQEGNTDDDSDSAENYEEFLDKVDDKRDRIDPSPSDTVARKDFKDLDILAADEDRRYTVYNLFQDLGYTDPTNDEMDVYMALRDRNVTIGNPQHGTGMNDVKSVTVDFEKIFFKKDSTNERESKGEMTRDRDEAYVIPSTWRHISPTDAVLNAQIKDGTTANLPVDATRRIGFLDKDESAQELNYLNVFDMNSITEFQSAVADLSKAVAALPQGEDFADDVLDFADVINEDQLADALYWRQASLDEKHLYVLTHYLGDEEPLWAKARGGYEIASMRMAGTASELFLNFNPEASEGLSTDEEFARVKQEVEEATALQEEEQTSSSSSSGMGSPILITEWIREMQEWVQSIKTTATSVNVYEGGDFCGDTSEVGAGGGGSDGGSSSKSLSISSSDYSVLDTEGANIYRVAVQAIKSDGSLNTEDSSSEVELQAISGESTVNIHNGISRLHLVNGVATFWVQGKLAGEFTLKANDVAGKMSASNTLTGSVSAKHLVLTTNTTEDVETDLGEDTQGSKIEIKNATQELIAIFDPATGELDVRNGEAVLKEASVGVPTRALIQDATGVQASLYLIPNLQRVSIGDGVEGVFVQALDESVLAKVVEAGIGLFDNTDHQIGLVNEMGQIQIGTQHRLSFSNPGEINLYEPFLVQDLDGNSLFSVTIKHPFVEANIEAVDAKNKDLLSKALGWKRLFAWVKTAKAALSIQDSDEDLLDDLEEKTIGTDPLISDTDEDGTADGKEVFAGQDPLKAGAVLFSDVSSTDSYYHDIALLVLRGVLTGYSDGSFRPDRSLSREEFVKVNLGSICLRCAEYSENYKKSLLSDYAQDPFPDTDINENLLACVAEGKTRGIVSGYANGSKAGFFKPKDPISGAEATKVIVETAELPVTAKTSDLKWYDPYVRSAEENQLFPKEFSTEKEKEDWLKSSITRSDFAQMAVRLLEAKDCRGDDQDGEGLSDLEETSLYGTNPNLADTDAGGINDLAEVLRESDPLNAADDFPTDSSTGSTNENGGGTGNAETFELGGLEQDPGLYVVSNHAALENISVNSDSTTTVDLFTSEIPADGQSVLFVQAEIRDENNAVTRDDNSSVIEFLISDKSHGTLFEDQVQVEAGVAKTVFKSSFKAGEVQVEARLRSGGIPGGSAPIDVLAGDPIRLRLSSESKVLPAGAEAVSTVNLSLYDASGNISNHGFYTVTLSSDGGLTLLDLTDEDASTDGVQVSVTEGSLDFRVLAAEKAGKSILTASLTEQSLIKTQLSIDHLDDMELKVTPSQSIVFAGGTTSYPVAVSVVNGLGQEVTGYQGEIQLSMSDPSYGSINDATFLPGTLAGKAQIIATSSGLESGSAEVLVEAGKTSELRIRHSEGAERLSAGSIETFYVEAYDIYGNLADLDSSTKGKIGLTSLSSAYGNLLQNEFTLNQGASKIQIETGDGSGTLNMIASSEGLISGTWTGPVSYSVEATQIQSIQPQMLYGSLMGGPFGDFTQENYVAGWMTFNGRTQAMSSLIADPNPKKLMVGVDGTGAILFPDDGLVSQSVLPAGKQMPVRIQWRQFPSETLLGDLFYVLPSTTKLSELLSPSLLTQDSRLSLEWTDSALLLREDAGVVAKVRQDGQIVLLNPNYNLSVPKNPKGMSFLISRATEPVLQLDFQTAFTEDVQILESDFSFKLWDGKKAGLYFIPTVHSQDLMMPLFSGNSSATPQGLGLIQKNTVDSTSSKTGEESFGWEGDNKNLLLFAAGNTVGQSNLFYASDIGVVLGDPTLALSTPNSTNAVGFTQDMGTQVAASQEDIQYLVQLDFNGDEKPDFVASYEDGRIDLLENMDSKERLHSRGTLLFIENGIGSLDAGDFNADGLSDLLIATENPCYADEMCLYVYENIGGGFTAKNLSLKEIKGKPKQVEVVDLNNDNYDDIVLVDENLKLYVIWNEEGSFSTVDELKDFGLSIEPSNNLWNEVSFHMEGLLDGSLNLPIEHEKNLESTDGSSNVNDFVESLKGNGFEVEVDSLEPTGSTTVRKESAFDTVENESLQGLLAVQKSMSDSNGGRAEIGDVLTVTIKISNRSSSAVEDLYFSDEIPGFYAFNESTLACLTCDEVLNWSRGNGAHPFVAGPLTLAASEVAQIQYTVNVSDLPQLTLMVGQDILDDTKDDNYADIGVSIEGNTTGTMVTFYSDGTITEESGGFLGIGGTSFKRVQFYERNSNGSTEEPVSDSSSVFGDENENGVPDFVENMSESGIPIPSSGVDIAKDVLGAVNKNGDKYYNPDELFQNEDDQDGDGLVDLVDDWNMKDDVLLDPSLNLSSTDVTLSSEGEADVEVSAELNLANAAVDQIYQKVEGIISKFTCNGGCFGILGSMAFLTPGTFHSPILGIPFAIDPGFPVFGILPTPIPMPCAGPTCAASIFRLYLSPTTTLGLGMGICAGPFGSSCIALSLPILQMTGICDAINSSISNALSGSASFATSGDNKVFSVKGSAGAGGDSALESSIFSNYEPITQKKINIQVPGFPSIFTEWWKAQKFELFKMLDLPDITFIYPSGSSFVNEFTKEEPQKVDFDQSSDKGYLGDKVQSITGSFMGLEGFLNQVHSLPLIDIELQAVDVHYPDLTPEEVEAIKRDFEDFKDDTKAEWKRFADQFLVFWNDEARDAAERAIQMKIFHELESAINDLLTDIDANLAVIDSYAHIPEELLKIRFIEAYYAKVIVCYLDAILGFAGGYLAENANRVKGWIQWVLDLQQIIKGWQLLLDIAINMMDSCDKCTNQRWSLFHLLLSLFIFIPDLPVIELPKLPNLVLDVSHIQAGVNIIWPDINFVPEPIDVPELPRISLPTVYLKGDLDLNVDLPVLPEFPINLQLPPLPALPLPNLPSLPPPPSIPNIFPTLKVSLQIVSNILKLVCLIRSGFMPVSETMLKTQIEQITERPGGFVLPFDLALTVEWPSFSLDYLKTIEVVTYLNLTPDLSAFYDLVKGLADQSNVFIGEGVGKINKSMLQIRDKIQSVFDVVGSIEAGIDVSAEASASEDGVDAKAEAEAEAEVKTTSYTDPMDEAQKIALQYKDEPMMQSYLGAFNNQWKLLGSQIEAWDKEMPEEIRLVATQEILNEDDPRLNRYDEVIASYKNWDPQFLASIQETPLAKVALLRDSLIAYTENLDQNIEQLQGMDGNRAMKFLAQTSGTQTPYALASAESDSYSTATPLPDRLLASTSDATDALAGTEDYQGTSAQTQQQGIYIYNAEAGVAEALIKYQADADKKNHILFSDLDGDGDEDIVYSLGGDVYIKENHTETPSLRYLSSDPSEGDFEAWDTEHGTVKNLRLGRNQNEASSVSFNASVDSIGYEITLYDSKEAVLSAPAENIQRRLLMNREYQDSVSVVNENGVESEAGAILPSTSESQTYQNEIDGLSLDLPKETEFVLPTVRPSRIWASHESGDTVLHNARKRTSLSGGRIESTDVITIQSTKDSVFEIDLEDSTVEIKIPAFHRVDFPAGNRSVKMKSGAGYWIQAEILETQDLKDGMEIFADEEITLDGFFAEAKLSTTEGQSLDLDNEESFVWEVLSNAGQPSANFDLENGAYYGLARGLFEDGSFGTWGENILMNPQVCADSSAPYPIISESSQDYNHDGKIDVAIFSTVTLSAKDSFDTDSEIVDAAWDLDSSVDADGNGTLNDDEEVLGLDAEIGPYDTVDDKEVTLWVKDTAGNQASATTTVNVYVPSIALTEAIPTNVAGKTDPSSPNLPFHLVRERDGIVQEIGQDLVTDSSGNFDLSFYSSDFLAVYDMNGEKVAQYSPTTKQLLALNEAYAVTALAANDPWPSRLVLYEKASNTILASFIVNVDSKRSITTLEKDMDSYELSSQTSVSVHLLKDELFRFNESGELIAPDPQLATPDLVLGRDGNLHILDTERFTLQKREASSLDEYLILEVYDEGKLAMEYWPGNPGLSSELQLVSSEDLQLPESSSLKGNSQAISALKFEDISEKDPLYDSIYELVDLKVLQGYEQDGKQWFKPTQNIQRSEFTKIILAILCLSPRPEAYDLPAVFNDISDPSLWYYAVTKESQLLGLITGYLKEIDGSGQVPFKPGKSITRAEAVKIILEALDMKQVIELPVLEGTPWYAPYMEFAQNMDPYIVTAEEASDPMHVLTRYEFVEMALRVLKANNCFEDLPQTESGENAFSADPGIYAVTGVCNSCPCTATMDYDSILRPGDKVFAIIQNKLKAIFGQSNTLTVSQ